MQSLFEKSDKGGAITVPQIRREIGGIWETWASTGKRRFPPFPVFFWFFRVFYVLFGQVKFLAKLSSVTKFGLEAMEVASTEPGTANHRRYRCLALFLARYRAPGVAVPQLPVARVTCNPGLSLSHLCLSPGVLAPGLILSYLW